MQDRGRGFARDADIAALDKERFSGGGEQVQRRDTSLVGCLFGVGHQR